MFFLCYESVSLVGCEHEAPSRGYGCARCAASPSCCSCSPAQHLPRGRLHVRPLRPATCVTPEVRAHNEAVFGHFSTLAAAKSLKARARPQPVSRESRSKMRAVAISKWKSTAQTARPTVRASRRKRLAPGSRSRSSRPRRRCSTRRAGHRRLRADAHGCPGERADEEACLGSGFLFIDLVREGKAWLVVMPQVPVKHALSIAHEAATAGYHIQFRTGTK